MPNIKFSQGLTLVLLAIIGSLLWITLALPRYKILDVSIHRNQAEQIAQNYLRQKIGISPQGYRLATVFSMDTRADRYLQKTLGGVKAQQMMDKLKYEFSYWNVRFFKEQQKEEFRVVVSSKTGEVLSFTHYMEETAALPFIEIDAARQLAIDFMKNSFSLSIEQFNILSQNTQKKENRTEYSFTWNLKGLEIPWNIQNEGGKATLEISAVVSGEKILFFNKGQLRIPEGFTRYIDKLKQTGDNLMLVSHLLYLGLLIVAIMLLVNRKRYVVPRIVKPFYLAVAGVLFVSVLLDLVNGYQQFIFGYPTTQSFWEYVAKDFVSVSMGVFFMTLVFILPGLSGEALRYESCPQEKARGFLHNCLASFYTVSVARQIWIGYLITPMILGIQAVIFMTGYKYFGVWDELSWLAQSSTATVPALTAFVSGFHAAITEEIIFRLFAISLFQRFGLNSVAAVLLSSVMWGFGHTGYAVFPMWFRGLEVSLLGVVFGFMYLRFGLVTVIVAHFLIDAFRASQQYFLNPHWSLEFLSCLTVLLIPVTFSLFAIFLNRSNVEKPWKNKFTPQQEFNYQLLNQICSSKTPEQLEEFKKELVQHGWDPAIIERVFEKNSPLAP